MRNRATGRLLSSDTFGVAELPSAAPVVGSVRPMLAPHLVPTTVHRVAAVMLDSVRMGDLHVARASLLGAGHGSVGAVRQDAYNLLPRKAVNS